MDKLTLADNIRNKKPIRVGFPNGDEFLIYEISPITFNRIWDGIATELKFDPTSDEERGIALMKHPEEVMTPLLNAILCDPKLGKKADEDHIIIEDISIPVFNQLLAMSRGVVPEIMASFRPRVVLESGHDSS